MFTATVSVNHFAGQPVSATQASVRFLHVPTGQGMTNSAAAYIVISPFDYFLKKMNGETTLLPKFTQEIIIAFSTNLEKLTKTTLSKLLENIYNGVNGTKKIKVENVTVDVPKIIKQKKLNIRKKDLKEFKGAF